MAKKAKLEPVIEPAASVVLEPDPFAAPPDVELPYIPAAWRAFAVRADSLVIDVADNVKLHGDRDLSAQQASLKDWQFTRMIIVRRANRQVVIGNGSVLAAMRNGWDYVPVDFRDLTEDQARALGAADNMVGTLADWNEANVQRLLDEMPALDLGQLDLDLANLCGDVFERLKLLDGPPADPASVEPPASTEPVVAPDEKIPPADPTKPTVAIALVHRVIVRCLSEAAQLELCSELMNRGLECNPSTIKART